MMTEFQVTCNIEGKKFYPSKLPENLRCRFSECYDVGNSVYSRRYQKDVISTYGYAFLNIEGKSDYSQGLNRAIVWIKKYKGLIEEWGGKFVLVHLLVFYQDQCNLEFPKKQMKELADLGLDFTISCVQE